jgi:hypothetical protein
LANKNSTFPSVHRRAGKTLSKLGTVPQQIAGGNIHPALEKAPSTPPNGSALRR